MKIKKSLKEFQQQHNKHQNGQLQTKIDAGENSAVIIVILGP